MEDLFYWQSKFESCYYSDRLIAKITLLNEKTNDKVDINEIKKAIYYAKKYHGSQKRLSGEPYYTHPLCVAEMVADYVFKTDILVTSILHDTLEDTQITKEIIVGIFGNKVAEQVNYLTRVNKGQKITPAESIEFLWLQKKEDLLIVKLFDRIHNMQTIDAKSLEKQQATICETLLKFLPIAAGLSLFQVEQMIDQLCFNAKIKSCNIINNKVLSLDFEEYSPIRTLALAFQNATQPK